MSILKASAELYQTFKEKNLKSDPTVVLAFDDYHSMYEFWMGVLEEHKDQMFFGHTYCHMRENQSFQVHGVKYILRLKIKE